MKQLKPNTKKFQNGITLIALVITIIVLLILAGVSIATLTGENGILTRVQDAKNNTEQAEEDELRRLTALEAVTNLETYLYEDKNRDTATIPAGFAVSQVEGENTIADGLVIIDKNGNEFVWIPVASISEIANATSGTDTNGNPNYQGKLYNFPTATTSEEKTSYGQGTTSYREPATVTGSNGTSYDGDTTNNYLDIINEILGTTYSSSDTSTFLEDMQKDYNKMVKSIGRYHGFYVSRYEMSKSTTANQAASIANVTPLVNDSSNMWYGLYAYGKTYNTSSVESSMIWGSQYDAMMRWMQDNDVDVKGNIGDNRNRGTTTGTTGTDIINNIYDLYGCHYEWTLEACDTEIRSFRGR